MPSNFWLYFTLTLALVISISFAIVSAQVPTTESAIVQRYFELLQANRETRAYSLDCHVNAETIALGQIDSFEIIELKPQTVYGLTYTNARVTFVPSKSNVEVPRVQGTSASSQELTALMEVWKSDDYYQADVTRVERVNSSTSSADIEKPLRRQFSRNTLCVIMRVSGNINGLPTITWP
jgi:hypothetical protein